jgi:GxxExxY protein
LEGEVFACLQHVLLDNPRLNEITGGILGAAIEVHRTLGPGLLESIYAPCLHFEFATQGLRYVAQRAVPITYKSIRLEAAYRLDLIVEDLVVVEIKSVDLISPVHRAQLLTYLRLTGCPAGLIVNFNVPRLMDGGVKRLVHPESGGNGGGGGSGKERRSRDNEARS